MIKSTICVMTGFGEEARNGPSLVVIRVARERTDTKKSI